VKKKGRKHGNSEKETCKGLFASLFATE